MSLSLPEELLVQLASFKKSEEESMLQKWFILYKLWKLGPPPLLSNKTGVPAKGKAGRTHLLFVWQQLAGQLLCISSDLSYHMLLLW